MDARFIGRSQQKCSPNGEPQVFETEKLQRYTRAIRRMLKIAGTLASINRVTR